MRNIVVLLLILMFLVPCPAFAFTRVTDLSFNGTTITPDQFEATFETIKANIKANKKIKGKRNKLPTKISVVYGRQADAKNIQLEIDTSEVLLKSQKDVQLPISNLGFLNAVQEAISLFENVEIADIMFKPLRLTSAGANQDDGRNVITFRAAEPPEGIGGTSAVFSIINVAKTENVVFMGQKIMTKPGTLLDVDVVFDPANDPCLAYFITQGDFKIGGDDSATVTEGGIDAAEVENCEGLSAADLVDYSVRGISRVLGFESSAIASSAFSRTPRNMIRYKLTNDDEIALASLYPNVSEVSMTRGIVSGKVLINKTPHIGVHLVLQDLISGEPVAGTFTDIDGKFEIKAVPEGTYTAYTEPLDGRVRPTDFVYNSFASNAMLNFSTAVFPEPISVKANMTTNISLEFENQPGSAFNLNTQVTAPIVTEKEAISGGLGVTPLPIRVMPGQTLVGVKFWGDNITTNFGTLSISGQGVTVTNVMDANVAISPYVQCQKCDDTPEKQCRRSSLCSASEELITQADQIPGITADIICAEDAQPGPRTIIFTGDNLDGEHPSFGLRDQITGGLIVAEP